MARTDPHRPGAILPTEYEWVASFGMVPIPGEEPEFYGMEELPGEEAPWVNIHEGLWACDVCGANYNNGAVLLHKPTGGLITIGHNCAEKYSLTLNLEGWKAWHAAARDKRALAAIEMKHAKAAAAFKEANPLPFAAIELALASKRNEYSCPTHGNPFATTPEGYPVNEEYCAGCQKVIRSEARDRKNQAIMILTDMGRKVARYGSLSEKQIAFAVKLGETLRTWTPPAEEKTVSAPEGRVVFTGTVVSVKEREGYMGGIEYKATVKVTTPEGVWLAWMTANGMQKGETVTVLATLERGREAHFAFGKRPVVLTPEEAAAVEAKAAKKAAREAKKAAKLVTV